MIGILSGVLASLCSVLILAILFHFDHADYVTFLPKSITTASASVCLRSWVAMCRYR